MATITYNGKIAELTEGKTATLECAGKRAKTDIVAVLDVYRTLLYKGTCKAVGRGKTVTLQCAGKKMATDLLVLPGVLESQCLVTSDGIQIADINGVFIASI